MPFDTQHEWALQRGIELAESLIQSCGPPSEHAQAQGLSEYWFNLDHVRELLACLGELRLGPLAIRLAQEAERAEKARAEAHASTLRKVAGSESPNHKYLMAAENGTRIGLGHLLLEIRGVLDRIAGHPNTYQRICNYIETIGVRDESGGYTIVDSIGLMNMMGELGPFRLQPSAADPKQIAGVAYEPEIGTPEYHAATCWELSQPFEQDTKVGRKQARYFPPESMRHLALAIDGQLPQAPIDEQPPPTHSDDFTSVNWYGTSYVFAKGHQAEAVKALWTEWERGGLGLSEQTIRGKIGSDASRFRLAHVFRKRNEGGMHPAWGTMIQPSGKGVFRLVPPESLRITK